MFWEEVTQYMLVMSKCASQGSERRKVTSHYNQGAEVSVLLSRLLEPNRLEQGARLKYSHALFRRVVSLGDFIA